MTTLEFNIQNLDIREKQLLSKKIEDLIMSANDNTMSMKTKDTLLNNYENFCKSLNDYVVTLIINREFNFN